MSDVRVASAGDRRHEEVVELAFADRGCRRRDAERLKHLRDGVVWPATTTPSPSTPATTCCAHTSGAGTGWGTRPAWVASGCMV